MITQASSVRLQTSLGVPLVLLWCSFGDLRTDPLDKIASDKKEKKWNYIVEIPAEQVSTDNKQC